MLAQKWTLVDFKTPRMERNLEQAGIRGNDRDDIIKDLVDGSYVHFKLDGTYEASILGSEPEQLFWKLGTSEKDSVLLVRKDNLAVEKKIWVELLTKEELVLVIPDIDKEFTRMYFKSIRKPDDN